MCPYDEIEKDQIIRPYNLAEVILLVSVTKVESPG